MATPSTSVIISQPGSLVPKPSKGALSVPDNPTVPVENGQPAFTCSLIFPLGRGAHGKTLWARWLLDELLNDGREVDVIDADRTNATLTNFFGKIVKTPASAEDADVESCLRRTSEAMMEQPRTTLIDFGANDLTLKRVARKLGHFDDYLASGLVRGVAVHFLGPDRDDLAYLRDVEQGVFAPRATILVLNEAMLPPGESTSLFDPIIADPIFKDIVERGGVPVFMPRLEAAREVNRLQLGFIAASTGQVGSDGTRLGPWNRSLVSAWRQKMAENHKNVMVWLR